MINRMTLQGRLTKDPDFRQTQGGTPVATFTVAWSDKYGENERKLFLPCVAWNNSAMFVCNYFTKGSEIIVEGTLSTRKWLDKEGNNRETTEMTVERTHFAGGKQNNESTVPTTPSNSVKTPEGFAPAIGDEQLPF